MADRIRVLLVDDQELVRYGFRLVLEAQDDMVVVGEASDGAEAVSSAKLLKPEVILMDVRMPGVGGIEATRRILAELPDTRVLVLTTHDRDVFLLVGRGLTNTEIAQSLHLSESTVKAHFGRILDKLDLSSRVQAVILAYELGVVGRGA